MQANRIFICGPSGVGKTKLALELSKQTGIPFIESSASDLWKQFGFKDHSDAITKSMEDHELALKYQNAILDIREGKLKQHRNFITDRSPFDSMVYFMIQNSSKTNPIIAEEFRRRCHEVARLGNQVIYIPFGDHIILEDNLERIPNPMFQYMVNSVFQSVIGDDYLNIIKNKEYGYTIQKLEIWDFETRIRDAKYFIKSPETMDIKWKL